VKNLLKQKVAQKYHYLKVAQKVAIILGSFILKKYHYEPPKVAQLVKIRPIWSPWLRSSGGHSSNLYLDIVHFFNTNVN